MGGAKTTTTTKNPKHASLSLKSLFFWMEGKDSRGVRRGVCRSCNCEGYEGGISGRKCVCGHPPGLHDNLDNPTTSSIPGHFSPVPTLGLASMSTPNLSFASHVNGVSPDTSLTSTGILSLPSSSAGALSLVPIGQRCIYPKCRRKKYSGDSITHQFCGQYHARQYKLEQHALQNSGEKCSTPGCTKFKYKEEGTVYDYCSIYCRDNQPKKRLVMVSQEECGVCGLFGCKAYRYQDPANGRIHPFCSRSHAFEAKKRGITVPDSDSSIQKVNLKSVEGKFVINKFQSTWAPGKGKCPHVSYIFSIKNGYLKTLWLTYKNGLGDRVVEEYFHGTKLECSITSQDTLCSNKECGICGIANTGFDRRCIRKNINFQRFGHGFYVAPNSSKCHDYTQGKHGYRAMILLDVCPGRKYELKTDDEKLTQPPAGFNSVHGKAGMSLNYDELVLYNPDGALPRYIILYQHDGEHKIAK